MPHLFDPLTLRGVTIRNRVGVSPMCQYSSEDGFANDWHLVHLGSRAVGGAGLVMAEATAVEARGRITGNDLGIWKDDHIEQLARITEFIRQQGATSAIQLAHAGRKASKSRSWDGENPVATSTETWEVVAPSAIPFTDGWQTPHELTIEEIESVIDSFVTAAQRAEEAGFDVIELHGAHGYLIHSFYSPLSNKRNDAYGGNFDGRTRFLLEITRRVRAVLPDHKPLFVRLSATDWTDDGWTIEDSVDLACRLKEEGVDLVDCSSGGIIANVSYATGAGYQVPLAEKVKRGADIPTAAVGMITQAMQADEIVRNGRADMAFMARELLRDPYWTLHAADVLHQAENCPTPDQYARAF